MANNISKNNIDEVDSAYQVLKTTGHPLYYRELIDRVVAAKGGAARPPAYIIAEIHTRINFDSRFIHTGKSMWGLTEWSPQRFSVREVEEPVAVSPDVRREKLFAAIQQDIDGDDSRSTAEPAELLEDEEEEDLDA